MPEFAAGLIFFNDAKSLARCLPTLSGFDTVLCIDGKYDTFDYPSALSDDGSREVVKQFPNTVLIDAPNLKEFQKRNVYFDECGRRGIDYMLIVDSDEWIEGDFELFKQNWIERTQQNPLHLRRLPIQSSDNPSWWQYVPIACYKPGELQYRMTHWTIARKDAGKGQWEMKDRVGFCEGIRMCHDHKLRNADYMRRRIEFQQKQKEYESGVNIITEEHEDDAKARIRAEIARAR